MAQCNKVRRPLDGRAQRELEVRLAAAVPRRWRQVERVALLVRLARRHGVIHASYATIARMWRASVRTVRRWLDAAVAAGVLARVAARGRGGGSVHVAMVGLDIPVAEVAGRLRAELAIPKAPAAGCGGAGVATAVARVAARLGAVARGLPGRLGAILQRAAAAAAEMGQPGTIDRNPESEARQEKPPEPSPPLPLPAQQGFAALYAILDAAKR